MAVSTDISTTSSPSYTFDLTVHIFDTDCFGVMWHGAYTKWLEMGRVDLLRSRGIELSAPDTPDALLYPVVEQNLRFRLPARINDRLHVTTQVTINGFRLVFNQTITHAETGKTHLEAQTTCVVLNSTWQTQRKLPPHLLHALAT